jgi:hypothetical protein
MLTFWISMSLGLTNFIAAIVAFIIMIKRDFHEYS